jgi:type IV pilus assembly protein PilN
MIRINLLPGPRARGIQQAQSSRTELVVGGGLILATAILCFYYSGTLAREFDAKQQEKQEKEKQIALLKDKVKQVQEFEERKKVLEEKNRVIEQLEKVRSGPVQVLDYVSQSMEPLKIWLTKLQMKGRDIELEGKALTNDDVVEFVSNLERTRYFANVRLVETRSGSEARTNLYQFRMNLALKG